jgi:hypothetical protein
VRPTLPNFVGIAAVKAGSTSIYHYLGEHPEVYVSPIKETNYFVFEGQREHRFRVRSWAEYCGQFAGATREPAVGEFSPLYVNHPGAAARIAAALPDVRLLASLRSPADRAYSDWIGVVRSGLESKPADEAIRPGSRYVEWGCYSRLLEPYFARFPRERIHIVLFEDLARDPAAVMAGIYRFLGVDSRFVPDVSRRHNESRIPRNRKLNRVWQTLRRLQPLSFRAPSSLIRWHQRLLERTYTAPPPVDPALRARLLEQYRDEVDRMEALLDRDLDAWRR